MSTIKIRAKMSQQGIATVKMLFKHPMETGQRVNKKTGKKVPAHYIQEVSIEHNKNPVFTANFSTAISKNPFLSFKFSGANKGDGLKVSWVDNKGESDSLEDIIK